MTQRKQTREHRPTRRDVLRGTLAGSAALAAATLGGRSRDAAAQSEVGTYQTERPKNPPLPRQAPPPIARRAIRSTTNVDVVVVGAGLSGLCAALSAQESGARVAVIEKGPIFAGRGAAQAAVGSQLQREAGIAIDKEALVRELLKISGYHADERLIRLWADNSGQCMDWLVGLARSLGLKAMLGNTTREVQYSYGTYPTAHLFGGNLLLISKLAEAATARGIPLLYEHAAVQLMQDKPGGAVTGVVAKTQDGLSLFESSQAVILCAGGFENSSEMLDELMWPRNHQAVRAWMQGTPTTTGDGIRMASWIGAAMQTGPHCLMKRHGALPNGQVFALSQQPWLNVNPAGERFFNELTIYGGSVIEAQPRAFAWQIIDSNWPQTLQDNSILSGERLETERSMLRDAVAAGHVVSAESIADLASKIGATPAVLEATVRRYNALAHEGRDVDFGKDASWLRPVERAPYFAINVGPYALVTLSGLLVDAQLRVLDQTNRPIEGLYAAGNTSGGFFCGTYPWVAPGLSHGRAFTFGRLAGLNAARRRSAESRG